MMCASGGMFLNLIQIKRFLMIILERICESGTDAIIIGGTDGVTIENVIRLNGSSSTLHSPLCFGDFLD